MELLVDAIQETGGMDGEEATEYNPVTEILEQAIEETRGREDGRVNPASSYQFDELYEPGKYVDALATTGAEYPKSICNGQHLFVPAGLKSFKTGMRENLERLHQEIQQEPTERSDSSSYSSQGSFERDVDGRLQNSPGESTHIPSYSSQGSFERDVDARLQNYSSESTHIGSGRLSSETSGLNSPLTLDDQSEPIAVSTRVAELHSASDSELIGGSSTNSSKRHSEPAQSNRKRRKINNTRGSVASSELVMDNQGMRGVSSSPPKISGCLARDIGHQVRRQSRRSAEAMRMEGYRIAKARTAKARMDKAFYGSPNHSTNPWTSEKESLNGIRGENTGNPVYGEWTPSGYCFKDTLNGPHDENILKIDCQRSDTSLRLGDVLYEPNTQTKSKLPFPETLPEGDTQGAATRSKNRSVGLTANSEPVVINRNRRSHEHQQLVFNRMNGNFEPIEMDSPCRQRQSQGLSTSDTNRSVSSNSNGKSHSNVSRVSRTEFKNKKHRSGKPYARTSWSNAAGYKDYSKAFGEPEGTVLVLSGSNFDSNMASSLKSGNALFITAASNSASDDTTDITDFSNSSSDGYGDINEASNSASDDWGDAIEAGGSDLDDTRDITEISNSISDDVEDITGATNSDSDDNEDTDVASNSPLYLPKDISTVSRSSSEDYGDVNEVSNSAFNHNRNITRASSSAFNQTRDITASSNVSSDDTLLGDNYHDPYLVPAELDYEKEYRQTYEQAAAYAWINNQVDDDCLYFDGNDYHMQV